MNRPGRPPLDATELHEHDDRALWDAMKSPPPPPPPLPIQNPNTRVPDFGWEDEFTHGFAKGFIAALSLLLGYLAVMTWNGMVIWRWFAP